MVSRHLPFGTARCGNFGVIDVIVWFRMSTKRELAHVECDEYVPDLDLTNSSLFEVERGCGVLKLIVAHVLFGTSKVEGLHQGGVLTL